MIICQNTLNVLITSYIYMYWQWYMYTDCYIYIYTYLEHVCPLFWGVFHPPEKDCSVNVRVIWVMKLTTGNRKVLLNGSSFTTLSKFQVKWSARWHHPKGNLVAKGMIWRKDINIGSSSLPPRSRVIKDSPFVSNTSSLSLWVVTVLRPRLL